jgi:hypothetical protein
MINNSTNYDQQNEQAPQEYLRSKEKVVESQIDGHTISIYALFSPFKQNICGKVDNGLF